MGRLLSVNVGLPREVTWQGGAVDTAIWKVPSEGPCMVRQVSVEGDGQGNSIGHGGERFARPPLTLGGHEQLTTSAFEAAGPSVLGYRHDWSEPAIRLWNYARLVRDRPTLGAPGGQKYNCKNLLKRARAV